MIEANEMRVVVDVPGGSDELVPLRHASHASHASHDCQLPVIPT
tara:strand:+ start:605 stop:736 length:132 start_codon:yes stop_codon:yes gene_type:complete